MEVRAGLGQLLADGEAVQGLWGCPDFCSWTRPHDHVLVDSTELAVDALTDEVLEVRHATPWALKEAERIAATRGLNAAVRPPLRLV